MLGFASFYGGGVGGKGKDSSSLEEMKGSDNGKEEGKGSKLMDTVPKQNYSTLIFLNIQMQIVPT